jgi:hypothetical protein
VFEIVDENALDGPSLAAAIERRLAGPSIRAAPRCDANGRAKTLALLQGLLAQRRGVPAA